MDAQADLSLCWPHSHFVAFVMSRLMYLSVESSSEMHNTKVRQILRHSSDSKKLNDDNLTENLMAFYTQQWHKQACSRHVREQTVG